MTAIITMLGEFMKGILGIFTDVFGFFTEPEVLPYVMIALGFTVFSIGTGFVVKIIKGRKH